MDEDYYLNVYSLPDTCKKGPLTFVKTGKLKTWFRIQMIMMMMKTSTFNNHSEAAKHKIITIKLNWSMVEGGEYTSS